MRIITIYSNFENKGGAQDVALQIAKHLNRSSQCLPIVLTQTPICNIIKDYKQQGDFRKFSFSEVKNLKNEQTIFISHSRNTTTLLMLYRILLGKNLKIVHVAHNTFTNLKWGTIFPKHIIAVSNGVKENLIDYFKIKEERIHVILNGMKDVKNENNQKSDDNNISILLPGRICPVKQQVEIVKYTKGKLLPHIHIYFAGAGEDEVKLKEVIGDSKQYRYLGHINMKENLNRFDYVCLFSKKEGLGLSLIEGCMFGKPLITNDLPSVLDVNKENETGFVFKSLKSLTDGLNSLPFPNSKEYLYMSHNARLRYESFFTEEKMIQQYKKILQEIL